MINVYLTKTDEDFTVLSVIGHAGQNEKGKDIVCSAVSMLVTTYAQKIICMHDEGKLVSGPKVALENGDAFVSFKEKAENKAEADVVTDTICIGFSLLENSYGEYVAFEADC